MSILAPPERRDAYVVFGQELRPTLDVSTWQKHAERFFATHVTFGALTRAPDAPWLHALSIVVAPIRATVTGTDADSFGTRSCWSRPSVNGDALAAFDAESKTGLAGLSDLARRCKQVWLIEVGGECTDDPVALRIAAILAGVVLGPILVPHGKAIFGPKTARSKLSI